MGLAQLTERPRNWITQSHSFFDNLSLSDNGEWAALDGNNVVGNNRLGRAIVMPYDIVVERIFLYIHANSLDALSVNTFRLDIEGTPTGDVLTLTDSSPTITLIEITGMNQPIDAGDDYALQWLSDSVGTCGIRSIGYSYRIVNPRV